MLRTHLRALQAIQADLGRRPGTEDLQRAARQLFAFYDLERRLADVLVGSAPPPPTKPAYKRGKPKRRKRRLKLTTGDHVLHIFQDLGEPMASREIAGHLARRGQDAPQRGGMSYVLRGLWKEGKIQRIETGTTPVQVRWKAKS